MTKKRSKQKVSTNSDDDSFLEDTWEYADRFHRKFRKKIVTSVVAAFGFLIALSWRKPIEQFVNLIIETAKLQGNEIYVQIISAILVTIIAVLGIMFVSRWDSKKDQSEKR